MNLTDFENATENKLSPRHNASAARIGQVHSTITYIQNQQNHTFCDTRRLMWNKYFKLYRQHIIGIDMVFILLDKHIYISWLAFSYFPSIELGLISCSCNLWCVYIRGGSHYYLFIIPHTCRQGPHLTWISFWGVEMLTFPCQTNTCQSLKLFYFYEVLQLLVSTTI